jgi:peptide/nickel transport system substrate-binding protein
MKKKVWLPAFVLLMLLSVWLPACTPTATPASVSTQPVVEETAPQVDENQPVQETPQIPALGGGNLSIGISVEPETLDPGDAVYIAEQFVLMNIFDTLLAMDPQGELHPWLAIDWSPNSEFTEFTFNLRQDVRFHDGAPFNAAAVKMTFDHIVNDVETSGGKTMLANYTESMVDSDYTITVKFSAPYPTFLNDVSRPWLGISSPAALEQYGADYGRHPTGTGPFMFSEWMAQEQIVLVRNPDYSWAPEFSEHQGPAPLDGLVFRILPEAATRLTALETGEIQIAEEPPALDAVAMEDAGTAQIQTFSSPGMPSHMMINTEKAPTDDLRVRQAMVYAVNQEELVQTAFNRLGSPAHSVLSPTTWSFNQQAADLYRYDPEKAAQLLDEAGWVDDNGDGIREKDGENLSLEYLAIPAYEEAFMELLAAYLQQAGFEVNIRTMDDAGVFAAGSAGEHNLLNMGWVSIDPGVLNIVYNSANIDGGSSFTRFTDADLDGALNDAQTQTDRGRRKADYETIQQIIMENALIIPVHNYNRIFIMAPVVQGFSFDVEGYPWLYGTQIVE